MSNVFLQTPHALSTKADGSMKKIDGSVHLSNIKKFLTSRQLPTRAVCMGQIHGGAAAVVTYTHKSVIQGVDGIVSNVNGVSLCVVSADCLPLSLYDPEKEAIGIIHAGFRGLLKNIIHSTIHLMVTEYESNPRDIQVFIGPAIEEKCYEVGKEVIEQFKSFQNQQALYSQQNGRYFLSLQKAALQCLEKEGILKKNITVSEQCTKCNVDAFYSYRRGDKTDRVVSVISLL